MMDMDMDTMPGLIFRWKTANVGIGVRREWRAEGEQSGSGWTGEGMRCKVLAGRFGRRVLIKCNLFNKIFGSAGGRPLYMKESI